MNSCKIIYARVYIILYILYGIKVSLVTTPKYNKFYKSTIYINYPSEPVSVADNTSTRWAPVRMLAEPTGTGSI